MCQPVVLLILAALALLFLFFVLRPSPRREGFKVLGSLANQAPLYYRCLSECERTDPAKQLGMTHGSMSCQSYCESTITNITRRGGSSFPCEIPLKKVEIVTRDDESYKRCGDGTKGEWCRALYTTDGEIDARCRQQCQYSTDAYPVCMSKCAASMSGNRFNSGGWTWK